tara:strand:- start:1229 stop:1387 length:159 start_codon:yes stop_codon:yes gene_type:complete
MDRQKLKLIYKNLKSLVDALEAEVYSDPDAYTYPKQVWPKEKVTYSDQIEEL